MYLKKLLFYFFILTMLCSCGATSKQLELVDHRAPEAIFYPLDSAPRALSSEKGHIVVLAFWDSGCHHCKREMPILNELAGKYAGNSKLKFIAISTNSASEESYLRSTIDQLYLLNLEHAFSGNDIYDPAFMAFKGEAIPYFAIIDQGSQVDWLGHDAADVQEQLNRLLNTNQIILDN